MNKISTAYELAASQAKESNNPRITWINEKGITCHQQNIHYVEPPEVTERRLANEKAFREREHKRMFSGTQYKHVGEGWHSFVKPLEEFCVANGIGVAQIKEKFSQLRFYTQISQDNPYAWQINGWIEHAEEMSSMYCEVCGLQGYIDGKYWIKTYCKKHHDERNNSLSRY